MSLLLTVPASSIINKSYFSLSLYKNLEIVDVLMLDNLIFLLILSTAVLVFAMTITSLS